MSADLGVMQLAARSPKGVEWMNIDPKRSGSQQVEGKILSQPSEKTINGTPYHGIRCLQFSDDGELLVYSDRTGTYVVKSETSETLHRLPLDRTAAVQFSPDNKYLCTWEPYAIYGKNPEKRLPDPNCRTWSLATGELLGATIQKRQDSWAPQWTSDGKVCVRANGAELFFSDENQQNICKKVVQCLKTVAISKGPPPYHLATYLHSDKGQPGTIRLILCDLNNFPTVANKSSWKADSVKFVWNSKGTAVLCTTEAEVDASNQSYYGEQQLYLMLVGGEGIKLNLDKKGPVYAKDWHPNGHEFCCVYGFMPARATVFNLKGEVVIDMAEGPRNECIYNALGNMLLISGFGNLPGQMEFWSTEPAKQRLVCKMKVANTTMCHWAPDGQHIVTATTAPRLRIDNGFRVWHYTGACIAEQLCGDKDELHEVKWRPRPIDAAGHQLARPFSPVYLTKEQRDTAGLDARGKVQSNQDLKSMNGGAASAGGGGGGDTSLQHPADKLTSGGVYVPPHLKGKLARPTSNMSELTSQRKAAAPKVANSDTEKKILKLTKQINKAEQAKKKLERGEEIEANQTLNVLRLEEMKHELELLKAAA